MTENHGGPPHGGAPTSGNASSDHFDTDTLADHAEGLLEQATESHVSAHVTWCTECGAVVDQLRSVQTLLSSLPAPELPDDVARRIDASLAQAQQERANLTPGAQDSRQAAPRRSKLMDLFFRRPQLLAGAAVLVVALAFTGGYLATNLGSGENSASTPGQSNALPSSHAGDPMTTGTNYTAADLGAQTGKLVDARKSTTSSPDPEVSREAANELGRLMKRGELDKCVRAVTGGADAKVVAIDLAKFDGTPAAIVVMSVAGKADEYLVKAVGAGCTSNDANVLYEHTVPRR